MASGTQTQTVWTPCIRDNTRDTLGWGKAPERAEISAPWTPNLWKASPRHDTLKEQVGNHSYITTACPSGHSPPTSPQVHEATSCLPACQPTRPPPCRPTGPPPACQHNGMPAVTHSPANLWHTDHWPDHPPTHQLQPVPASPPVQTMLGRPSADKTE
jgi:hypothetical protein